MARIRTIKPEFVESESVGKLSREGRLLFVLLWTFVDDEGRARASSRLLASRLYPYDDDAPKLIGFWLEELDLSGHIRLYDVDGDSYLDIPKWLKHQKIDHPSKSRLPAFSDDLAKPRESVAPHTLDLVPSTLDLGKKDNSTPRKPRSADTRGSRLPDDWKPSEEDQSFATDLGVDAQQTADEFRDYWTALPGSKGRKLDWSKTWRNRCRELAKKPRGTAARETYEEKRQRENLAVIEGYQP